MTTELLDSIRKSMKERGYPPTMRELADELGVSLGTVHARMVRLEEEGRIVRETRRGVTKRLVIVEEESK